MPLLSTTLHSGNTLPLAGIKDDNKVRLKIPGIYVLRDRQMAALNWKYVQHREARFLVKKNCRKRGEVPFFPFSKNILCHILSFMYFTYSLFLSYLLYFCHSVHMRRLWTCCLSLILWFFSSFPIFKFTDYWLLFFGEKKTDPLLRKKEVKKERIQ